MEAHLKAWMDRKGNVRQDGLWPYLLVRACAGDHGVRPLSPKPFWESPDILVVPGDVPTYDGVSATLSPAAGRSHTVFVHAWNIGRLVAIGVKVSVFWANPAFSFDDPNHPPTLIGGAFVTLPDRLNPQCHALVRIPQLWIPTVENNGHECLLARVECITDGGSTDWDANHNRHVGQRNVQVISGNESLEPLLNQLALALPRMAELQLLHGMAGLKPLVLASAPAHADSLSAPTAAPALGFALADGTVHLGAVAPSPTSPGTMVAMPASIAGPTAQSKTGLAAAAVHPLAQPVPPHMTAPEALIRQLGVKDLTASAIAASLGGATDAHVLRFQAMRDGRVVGGYTLIVKG